MCLNALDIKLNYLKGTVSCSSINELYIYILDGQHLIGKMRSLDLLISCFMLSIDLLIIIFK